jgi:mRNA turnover protein 4
MPKSKRNKVGKSYIFLLVLISLLVSLTKVKKKGKEHKGELVEKIHESLEKFKNCFALSFENMTTVPFRKIQDDWVDSKFYLGKNKVMQVALGRTPEEEPKDNFSRIGRKITGQTAILFTNKSEKFTKEYFNKFSVKDFAKGGTISSKTIQLEKGILDGYSHALEPYLRQLGNHSYVNLH